MKTVRRTLLSLVVTGAAALVACSSSSSGKSTTETTAAKVASERSDAISRLNDATELVNQFNDKIPQGVSKRAHCVVAIPSMSKGGLVVGASAGKGFATCRTSTGWSAPAPVTIGGGSFGAQVGYQSSDVLALVMTSKGTKALLSGQFRVGADASATAGPVGTGRGGDISTDADVASYSRSKGLFAGAELNGSELKFDADAARGLFNSPVTLSDILEGRVAVPNEPDVGRFLSAVRTGYGAGAAK